MRYLFTMRRVVYISVILCFLSLAVKAQQQHFIYIQADNKLPFSVRLNGKYYSSSSIGYLIIPKLADGTYTFQVGFAQNSFPEQAFTLNVMGKDYGYALKNFDAKGWGLFNFQTTDVVMNSSAPQPEKAPPAVAANTSAFGNMLANVINDSTINNVSAPDIVAGTKPVATVPLAAAPDTTTKLIPPGNNADTANTITAKKEAIPAIDSEAIAERDTPLQDTAAFTATGVIKAGEKASDKGTDLMFIDFNGVQNDTINAFIPAATEQKAMIKTDTIAIAPKVPLTDTAKKIVSNPFFDNSTTTQNTATKSPAVTQSNLVVDSSKVGATPSKVMVNSTCTNMLSDGDLNKLKKRIISQSSQDAALAAVRKSLRDRCIATEQVKDLGNLFLNDESRYGFYDAVYPFVYDAGGYATLESTLIDPYFKNRFKALLR